MNIEVIENNIEKILNNNYNLIVELIIDAVRAYPIYELTDTDIYFNKVKALLNIDKIELELLVNYLDSNINYNDENEIWIVDSLNLLCEAFELMKLFEISFEEVINIMESISRCEK